MSDEIRAFQPRDPVLLFTWQCNRCGAIQSGRTSYLHFIAPIASISKRESAGQAMRGYEAELLNNISRVHVMRTRILRAVVRKYRNGISADAALLGLLTILSWRYAKLRFVLVSVYCKNCHLPIIHNIQHSLSIFALPCHYTTFFHRPNLSMPTLASIALKKFVRYRRQ